MGATSSTSRSEVYQDSLIAKLEALREASTSLHTPERKQRSTDAQRAPELLARASAVAKAGLEESRALVERLSPKSGAHQHAAASTSVEPAARPPKFCETSTP